MKKRIFLFLLFTGSLLSAQAKEGNPRIYGEVTTVANQVYRGYISWGRNKFYWVDLFEALKPENAYTSYLPETGRRVFRNNTQIRPATHLFICRFGDIWQIRPLGNEQAELTVRDGSTIRLNRGNHLDIGSPLFVEIPGGETVRITWDRLSEVELMEAPAGIPASREVPITGIIHTAIGSYKGFVYWDLDENSLDHLLDGNVPSGSKVSVPFRNIREIIKHNNHCRVVLRSGTEMSLSGSNDVDYRNRGIWINMPGIGRVAVPWKEFLRFEAVPADEVLQYAYADFYLPRRLSGEITLRNQVKENGVFAYDLDEAFDIEMLDGKNGEITYSIPFYNIAVIEPKNYRYTWLRLTNGVEMVLGDSCDVSAENDGILLFREGGATHIFWNQIRRIDLWTE